jgi:hypothetical protein
MVRGARICPGKKFAQVEFVAVMAAFFREHRILVVPRDGESLRGAQGRIIDMVEDSEVLILLRMKNPGSVAVRLAKADGVVQAPPHPSIKRCRVIARLEPYARLKRQ